MDIFEMCKLIDMPNEVTEELLRLETSKGSKSQIEFMERIQYSEEWDEALKDLIALLKENSRGLEVLKIMLYGALSLEEKFMEFPLNKEIFIDTMGAFSRFVREHKESFGVYGFDREWWMVRQLSLRLFRLGSLEYEKLTIGGKTSLGIHIPSDASLEVEDIIKSIQKSKTFFMDYDKKYVDIPYICESWLLSPRLKELLPKDSRIRKFQAMFDILEDDPKNQSFIQFLFKDNRLTLDQYPEKTRLQRSVKEYLKDGGYIGGARGKLKDKYI